MILNKLGLYERLLELQGLKEGLNLHSLSMNVFGDKVIRLTILELKELINIIEDGDYYV